MKITATQTNLFPKGKPEAVTSVQQETSGVLKNEPPSIKQLTKYTPTTHHSVFLNNTTVEMSDIAKFVAQTTAERNALMANGDDKYTAGRKVATKYLGKLKEETKQKIAEEAEKTASSNEESSEKTTEEEVVEEVVIDPSTGKKTIKLKAVKKTSGNNTKVSGEHTETKMPKVSSPKGTKVDLDV